MDHIQIFLTTQGQGGPPRIAQCRGHLRDSTNMKDETHQTHTHLFQQGEYEMMCMAAR